MYIPIIISSTCDLQQYFLFPASSHPDGTSPYPCCCPFAGSPSTKVMLVIWPGLRNLVSYKEILDSRGNASERGV